MLLSWFLVLSDLKGIQSFGSSLFEASCLAILSMDKDSGSQRATIQGSNEYKIRDIVFVKKRAFLVLSSSANREMSHAVGIERCWIC